MPGGVGALRISHPLFLLLSSLLSAKSAFANPLFSIRCALFQVPYPVSPLLATHTKTAGCIPTIPIPELTPSPYSLSHYLLTFLLRLLSHYPRFTLFRYPKFMLDEKDFQRKADAAFEDLKKRLLVLGDRSEERRVGKECRSRW